MIFSIEQIHIEHVHEHPVRLLHPLVELFGHFAQLFESLVQDLFLQMEVLPQYVFHVKQVLLDETAVQLDLS